MNPFTLAKFIEYIYFWYPVIYYIITIIGISSQFYILSDDLTYKMLPYQNVLTKLNDNLQDPLIVNLTILDIDAIDSCPEDFYITQLGQWPGTYAGCYQNETNTLLIGTCQTNGMNTSLGWVNIMSTLETTLTIWESYKFCIQIESNFTKSTNCSTGYTDCGGGYCIVEGTPCPITNILIVPNLTNINYENYSIINLPNEKYLLFTNESIANGVSITTPIVDISTSIESAPCVNPNRSPKNNQSEYKLIITSNNVYDSEEDYEEGCGPFGVDDNFTIIIDNENANLLYEYNGILGISQLPDYESLTMNEPIFLYAQRAISANLSSFCLSFNPANLSNQLNNFSYCSDFIVSLMVYSLFCFILMIITIIFLVVDMEENDHERFIREKRCFFHSFHLIPYIMCIIFIVEYQRLPEDQSGVNQTLLPYINQIIQDGCYGNSSYNGVFVNLYDLISGIVNGLYHTTKYLGIYSYVSIMILMILRASRGYFKNEVKVIEDSYLEFKYMQQSVIRNQQNNNNNNNDNSNDNGNANANNNNDINNQL